MQAGKAPRYYRVINGDVELIVSGMMEDEGGRFESGKMAVVFFNAASNSKKDAYLAGKRESCF